MFTMQSGGSSIKIAPTNCDIIETIGSGSFGIVLKVQHRESKTLLAKKMINLAKIHDDHKKYLEMEVPAMIYLSQNSIPNTV